VFDAGTGQLETAAASPGLTDSTPFWNGSSTMTDHSTPKKETNSTSQQIDAIAKVVADLHIAHRNLSIYPPTHEQAQKSVQKAYTGLSKTLEHRESLTFAVMKDGLFLDQTPLPAGNQICTEFAHILKKFQVATLTFGQELDELELIRFLLLVGSDREEISDQGGIEAAAEACNLSNIALAAVDYSKLQLTQEHEIQRSDSKDQQRSVWQLFVTHILDGRSNQESRSDAGFQTLMNPDELARLLNQKQLDVKQALGLYDELLLEMAQMPTDDPQPRQGLQSFQAMIKELSPELRKQFLAATLRGCSTSESEKGTAQLIEGLGADLIVQMIRQASADRQQISPSLLSFIKRMGNLDLFPELMPTEGDSGQNALSSEQVSSLLAHEQYDHYVDEDYGILLDDLAEDDQPADSGSVTESLSQQLGECMAASNIKCQVSRAMTELMGQSPDPEEYRGWARQLSYSLDDLLEAQAFDCLAEMLAFVRGESINPHKEKAKIADIVLDYFNSPEYVAKAVERILKLHGEAGAQGIDFLVQLGEPVVVEIMDRLSSGETEIDRKILIQSLDKFGLLAAREAVERLDDPRLNFLRMMVQIVRRLGDQQSAESLRLLLDHADMGIRLEALGTLLRFKNNWGLIRLRELIDAPWSGFTGQAIALAGDYKVGEVVSNLIAYAQRRGDAQRQEASIRALGRIGDARAVPVLDKLARRRWSMSKKHQLHLKQVIFESLDGYAAQDILDLLHFGIKEKDVAIRSACEKMLRKIRMADRS
jgi:HEAT repeat protein